MIARAFTFLEANRAVLWAFVLGALFMLALDLIWLRRFARQIHDLERRARRP